MVSHPRNRYRRSPSGDGPQGDGAVAETADASAGVTTMAVALRCSGYWQWWRTRIRCIFHFDAVGTGSQSGVGGGSGKRGCIHGIGIRRSTPLQSQGDGAVAEAAGSICRGDHDGSGPSGILDIGGGGKLASVGIFDFDAVGTGSQSGIGGGSGKR